MLVLTTTIRQINADTGQYLAVTMRENGQEICQNNFTFFPGLLVDLEPQWMLDKAVPRSAADTTRRDNPTHQQTTAEANEKLAEYGRRLFECLFSDGRELANFLKFATDGRSPIRLILSMHGNAAPLWQLPWEYIHDEQGFWALSGRFHLSRRPEGLGDLNPEPVTLPLRILVIVSAPDDQALLDSEKEIGVIQDALDEAFRVGRVQVEYVDDATLENIGEQIRTFKPHVIHYTGHGAYDAVQKRSYLALENDEGETRSAGIDELKPHLNEATDLHLVFLSGCQTAQTSDVDVFRGVATGLLATGIPAVVAMQFSILDNSAIKLAEAFYGALARGESLAAATQAARIALWQFDEGPGYDWGIPALYLRTPQLRLVETVGADLPPLQGSPLQQVPSALINMHGLPLPPHFVGRKLELRRLRRALRDSRVKAVFVRGIGGIGKSSIVAKLGQRPGTPVDGVLAIRCHEVDPLDIPLKIASFLQGQGVPGHVEAGARLMDSRHDPAERAQVAAQLVANRRYLFIFDNFESLQFVPNGAETAFSGEDVPALAGTTTDATEYDIADPTLRGLFAGFLTANWRSLCVFTGRFRWRGFSDHVGRATAEEIHLPQLTARQAIMMIDNLPRLRREPIATKIAVWRKVGGHPKSIELLNGWLAQGQISDLLDNAALDKLLAPQWEAYFLGHLLAQLPAAERKKLARLAIFQDELNDDALEYAAITGEMKARWLDLSLLQTVGTGREPALPPHLAQLLQMLPPAERARVKAEKQPQSRTLVHPVVADYLLGQTGPDARRELHRWAADYYGQPFMKIAREYAQHTGRTWTDEQIEAIARDSNGVVGKLVAQTRDMGQARGAVARALAWRHHLFVAGREDEAAQIVTAVIPVLDRWGQLDQAKTLLRCTVESQEGANKAVAQANLANLLMSEGRLDEALATYQSVYNTFATLNARQQMVSVLLQMSTAYMNKGDLDTAIAKLEASLHISKEIGHEDGEASSLYQLSILYRTKKEYLTALTHSKTAEEIDRKRGNEVGLAADLHEQGVICIQMARVAEDEATGRHYWQMGIQSFGESLTIERRIGNEAGVASTLGELGEILRDAGRLSEAITVFSEALEIDRRLNYPVAVAYDLRHLGSVHEQQGEYAAALAKYQEALVLFQKYGPHGTAITESHIARIRAKMQG